MAKKWIETPVILYILYSCKSIAMKIACDIVMTSAIKRI